MKLIRIYNLRSSKKMIYETSEETIIFFDLETTGFNSFKDAIIEIAARDSDGNTFQELVDPERTISEKIQSITHITNEMVKGKRTIEHVLRDFVYFCLHNKDGIKRKLKKIYLCAHNCNAFDKIFLERNLFRSELSIPKWKYLDTLHLAQYLLRDHRSHSLRNLCFYWNLVQKNAHRAMSDVDDMIKIWGLLTHMWKTSPHSIGYDSEESVLDIVELYHFLQRI